MCILDSYELNMYSVDSLNNKRWNVLNKNMLKTKKAISPILATLLLIVIAVAAIVVTYAGVMTYVSTTTRQAGVTLYKENVRFYGTPTNAAKNRIDITVGNSGIENTKILRIYMGNSSANLIDITTSSDIGTGKTLNSESTRTIIVTWPNSLANAWEAEKTYHFKVASSTGQYLTFSMKAST